MYERGIDISYETVRAWWNKFGPVFAFDIRKKPASCEMYVLCCHNGSFYYRLGASGKPGAVHLGILSTF